MSRTWAVARWAMPLIMMVGLGGCASVQSLFSADKKADAAATAPDAAASAAVGVAGFAVLVAQMAPRGPPATH